MFVFLLAFVIAFSHACSCIAPANALRLHGVTGLKTKPTLFVLSRAEGGEAVSSSCKTSPLRVEEFAVWDVTSGALRCLTEADRALERDADAVVAGVASELNTKFVPDSLNRVDVAAGGSLNVTIGSQTVTTTLPEGAVPFVVSDKSSTLFLATALLDSNHVVLLFSNAVRKIELLQAGTNETTVSLAAWPSPSFSSNDAAWSSRHRLLRLDSILSSCSNSGPIAQIDWAKRIATRPLQLGACGGAVLFNPANLIAFAFGANAESGVCKSTPYASIVTATGRSIEAPKDELERLLSDCNSASTTITSTVAATITSTLLGTKDETNLTTRPLASVLLVLLATLLA